MNMLCRCWKTALAALLAISAWNAAFAGDTGFFEPVNPPRPFQIVACSGQADAVPANTRSAFEKCVNDGVEWAVIDLRTTRDGRHVAFHDATLDEKTNGTGPVQDHTLAELKQLDAGSWFAPRFKDERILSLGECLEIARGRLNLCINCLSCDPPLLVQEIREVGMERQVIIAGSYEMLEQIQALSQGSLTVMPVWHSKNEPEPWAGKWSPGVVAIDANEWSADIAARFHSKKIKVLVNTLGQDPGARTWDDLLHAGVDFIQTDKPEEALAYATWVNAPRRPVQVSYHRGALTYAPENTMQAFKKAVQMGADYIEFDVRTTKDGKFYLLHDGDLDRTTDGKGPIAEMESDAVKSLDAGKWFGAPYKGLPVPTLDDILALLANTGTQAYVDAKEIPADALAAKLQQYGLVEKSVVYQSPEYIRQLHAIDPEIRGLCPLGRPEDVERLVETVHPYAFDTNWDILSPELIQRCHQLGVKVFSDAMGKHERIEDYANAMEWGIDLIQTNYPLRVYRAVELSHLADSVR